MKRKNQELNWSTREVNMNFRIKVFGQDESGRKVNQLFGVSGIINLIGVEMLNKLLERAFGCLDDVCVCKLRRGLKVSFYVK